MTQTREWFSEAGRHHRLSRGLPLALGVVLLLPACTGVGAFLDYGVAWSGRKLNAPAGDGDTLQRVRGHAAAVAPLLPEPGDVWTEPRSSASTLAHFAARRSPAPVAVARAPRPTQVHAAAVRQRASDRTAPAEKACGLVRQGARRTLMLPNSGSTRTVHCPDGVVRTAARRRGLEQHKR